MGFKKRVAAALSVGGLLMAGWLLGLVTWTEPITTKQAALVQAPQGRVERPLLYEEVDLRPMVDVDVLIRPRDWPRLREILM